LIGGVEDPEQSIAKIHRGTGCVYGKIPIVLHITITTAAVLRRGLSKKIPDLARKSADGITQTMMRDVPFPPSQKGTAQCRFRTGGHL
jgi:hypothetical protein